MKRLDERSKAKYQPWNDEEFRADIIVQSMTSVQRWMYRTLLQYAWVGSERPRLPNDDRFLWRYAGCESKEQWLENKEVVLEMFNTVTVDDKELLSNSRLEEDWLHLQEIREKRSESGKRGAEAKLSNC